MVERQPNCSNFIPWAPTRSGRAPLCRGSLGGTRGRPKAWRRGPGRSPSAGARRRSRGAAVRAVGHRSVGHRSVGQRSVGHRSGGRRSRGGQPTRLATGRVHTGPPRWKRPRTSARLARPRHPPSTPSTLAQPLSPLSLLFPPPLPMGATAPPPSRHTRHLGPSLTFLSPADGGGGTTPVKCRPAA